MTRRGGALLAISIFCLFCGMSLGGRMLYLSAVFGVLTPVSYTHLRAHETR